MFCFFVVRLQISLGKSIQNTDRISCDECGYIFRMCDYLYLVTYITTVSSKIWWWWVRWSDCCEIWIGCIHDIVVAHLRPCICISFVPSYLRNIVCNRNIFHFAEKPLETCLKSLTWRLFFHTPSYCWTLPWERILKLL